MVQGLCGLGWVGGPRGGELAWGEVAVGGVGSLPVVVDALQMSFWPARAVSVRDDANTTDANGLSAFQGWIVGRRVQSGRPA